MAFALIDPTGRVCDLVDDTYEVHEAFRWADIAGISPPPQSGWVATFHAGEGWRFTGPPTPPPAPTPPPSPIITPLEFLGRLTQAEETAIVTAAQASPALMLWLMKATAAQQIDLTDTRTIAGLEALVDAGLLTPARRTTILTP